MKVLKQREVEAEQKKRQSERIETIRDKISLLQKQHAWAQVEEQETILEKYQRQVQVAEQKVREKIEASEEVEGTYEGHNQSYEAAVRTVEEFQAQLRPSPTITRLRMHIFKSISKNSWRARMRSVRFEKVLQVRRTL